MIDKDSGRSGMVVWLDKKAVPLAFYLCFKVAHVREVLEIT